jgi:hypothetical protein
MAAFSPQKHPAMAPHLDYPANSPPDQAFPPLPSTSDMASMPRSSRKGQNRMSGELKPANGLESGRAIPTGPQGMAGAGPRGQGGYGPFDTGRSPPNSKSMQIFTVMGALLTGDLDTSHVPCKFFKAGQCQAGKACPFSHSTDASAFEQPCKYFSKVLA